MNVNIIKAEVESKKPKIQVGDLLLCADGHDLNYLLVVREHCRFKLLNLDQCCIVVSSEDLDEIYDYINRNYDIKQIINNGNISLNVQIEG